MPLSTEACPCVEPFGRGYGRHEGRPPREVTRDDLDHPGCDRIDRRPRLAVLATSATTRECAPPRVFVTHGTQRAGSFSSGAALALPVQTRVRVVDERLHRGAETVRVSLEVVAPAVVGGAHPHVPAKRRREVTGAVESD